MKSKLKIYKNYNSKMQCVKIIFMSFVIYSILFVGCVEEEKNIDQQFTQQSDTTWMKLTLREKIGQIICLRYNRTQIMDLGDNSVNTFLTKYPVGSFFMANWELSKNVSEKELKQEYIKSILELANETKYPLLFVEDFESGLGTTITDYTQLPGEMGLGATNSKTFAYSYGKIIASEARSIGINWLLHPVADLNINPFNFITNVRSISDNELTAINMLPEQVDGMQSQNVAATAKHFPGDGTDYINQHFNISKMKLSFEEWQTKHGKVFKTLIDNGVLSIMPGHISFPNFQKQKVDGEYLPATLSEELLTGLLKDKLGFKGVVVSDALNMAGISGYYTNQLETEIESFKAGCDVLLWPSVEIIDTLESRILREEIPIARLNDAVNRVWNMKNKLGLFEEDYQIIKQISQDEIINNRKKSLEIAKGAITLLSNKNKILPLDTLSSKKILIIIVSEKEELETFKIFKNQFVAKGFEVDILQNLPFFEKESELDSIAKIYDKILFTFYSVPVNPWGSLLLNDEQALTMWSANKLPPNKVISIGVGDPYKNLIYMPRTWGRVNCYSADEITQRALVDGLTGQYVMEGISPVRFPY